MDKFYIVHSAPYIGEMKCNSYREATQAEIDDAASEQMRKDAAVGRAMIKGARFGSVALASIHSSLWLVKYREDCDPPVYREAAGNSPKAALAAAGLMEEEGK